MDSGQRVTTGVSSKCFGIRLPLFGRSDSGIGFNSGEMKPGESSFNMGFSTCAFCFWMHFQPVSTLEDFSGDNSPRPLL